jgi:hypothetical protein
MTKQPFNNNSSQAEKQQVLRDEQRRAGDRAGTTYHALAGVEQALEGGGRFKSEVIISGAQPSVNYPASSGPWADPVRVPDEPSLGVAIDEQEPVGTAQEIAHSLSQFAGEETAGSPTLARVETDPSTSPAIPAPTAVLSGSAVAEQAASSSMAPASETVETKDDDAAIQAHAKLTALLSKGLRRRL